MNQFKPSLKRILGIITFTLLLYWGLHHPGQILVVGGWLVTILYPVLLGGAIAFVVNVLLRLVESAWDKTLGTGGRSAKLKRPVSMVLSLVIIALILFALVFIILPALKDSVANFAAALPQHLTTIAGWWTSLETFLAQFGIALPALSFDLADLYTRVTTFLANYGQALLDTTIGFGSALFSGVVNFFLALFFALYILAQKETLGRQATKLVKALFPEQRANWLLDVASLTNRTFSAFITGQLTEACILGSLCFVGMFLFKLPYASVVSVLVGFTALIPVFGAFIGIGLGAFLILLVSPVQAVIFVVFIIILQQLEGNLIYPRVVGSAVGLPGIWVLAAVTVGGNAFGLVGMLVAVPVCSVLYALLRHQINTRLAEKEAAKTLKEVKTDAETAPDPTETTERKES